MGNKFQPDLEPGRDEVIATLDSLAEWTIARARPMRVAIATQDEMDEVFRLRLRCVLERGWAQAQNFSEGVEKDGFDDVAVHVVARDEGDIVGTCRLVFPEPGRPLPTEEAFEIVIEPRGDVVDWGRLVVSGRYRGDARHVVSAALLARCWLEMSGRGYSIIGGAAARPIIEMYRSMGFEPEILGPPRFYWGEWRYPSRSVIALPRPAEWLEEPALRLIEDRS